MVARLQSVYPLTPLQQGLLFHTLAQEGRSAYVVQWQAELEGPLHTEALRRAWESVIDRHPVLRTAFAWERRESPVQAVLSRVDLPWSEEDWSVIQSHELESRWADHLGQDRQRGFDLTRAPLMRWFLVRLGPQRHRLLWSAHHLILDGWSTSIVLRDVLASYRRGQHVADGLSQRLPLSPLPPDPPPFQRHVQWLADQPREASDLWWRHHLAAWTGPCSLAHLSQRQSDAHSGGSGDAPLEPVLLESHLTPLDTAAAATAARRLGVTEATVALGAFLLCLHRLAGHPQPSVGLTHAGRSPAEPHSQDMVGLFINTVPLVAPMFRPWHALGPWFRNLQATQAGAIAHGHRALPELRRLAGLAESTPLFDQLFVFENYPDAGTTPPPQDMGGLKIAVLPGWEDPDQALTLAVAPGASWGLRWIADPRRHTPAALHRLDSALVECLRRLGSCTAEQPLSDVMPEMTGRNAGDPDPASFPLPAPSLWGAFDRAARAHPDSLALEVPGGPALASCTYRSLRTHALAWADELHRLGVRPGDRVGLVCRPHASFLAAMLGILHRGAAYVPLDPEWPTPRLRATLTDAGIGLVLCDTATSAWGNVVAIEMHSVGAPAESSASIHTSSIQPAPVDPQSLAYMMYTSGSTGEPKGVAIAQQAVLRLVATGGPMGLRSGLRVAWASALSFDASTLELWAALTHGGTLVRLDRSLLTDPAALALALPDLSLDLLWLTAGLFHLVVRAEPRALQSVDTVIAGGDALNPDVVAQLLSHAPPRRLLNGYGPTENTTFSTLADLHQPPPWGERATPIGHAIPGTELLVLDAHGMPVAQGVSGELHVGGLGLAHGYWGRPALTAEAFVPHPAPIHPGQRLYRTGDWVHWTPDGRLVFDGRRDAQLKVRGHRVEPLGIQALLAQAPGVAHAEVTVRRDESDQPQLLAAVQPHQPQEATASWATVVRHWLSERVATWSMPARLFAVDHWPLNLNGKVDWAVIGLGVQSGRSAAEDDGQGALDSSAPDEQLLASLWSIVLGMPHVRRTTHFFEEGGHSLLATILMGRVRQAFGVELPLRVLFDAPVLRDFLDRLRSARQALGSSDPSDATTAADAWDTPETEPTGQQSRDHSDSPSPLSFAQQRLWFLDRFAPLSAAYHIPHALHLQGRLDHAALQSALDDLVARHESLRTTFEDQDGAAVQRLHPHLRVTLEVRPLADDLQTRLTTAFEQPFDLHRGPLMRAVVFEQGPQDQWLLVVLHHIVADGWSMGILAREISQAYRARLEGRAPGWDPLPIQYADHARWQRRWLSGRRLQHHLDHWGRVLQDPPLVDVPTDRPRPPQQSFRGGQLTFEWPAEVVQAAQSLARRTDTTLFMVLSAAYLLLLGRLSGQRDLLVGLPVAGRSRLQTQGLIGFFVNMLPLRITLDAGWTVAELMSHIRRAALDAYDHQELPFEMLVERLSPNRDPSRQPLVQHTVAVHNVPGGELELPGLRLQTAHTQLDWVRFDLELHAWQDGPCVRGYWAYASDLFDRASIEGFSRLLQRAICEMERDPRGLVTRLKWTDAHQYQDHLLRWNATEAVRLPHHATAPVWVHEAVWEQLCCQPDSPALIQGSVQWSRQDLARSAAALTQHLSAIGTQTDDRVGLLMERSPHFVSGMLAITSAGAAYVPLDPAWPVDRLVAVCAACHVRTLVADRQSMALAQGVASSAPERPDCQEFATHVVDIESVTQGPTQTPESGGPTSGIPNPVPRRVRDGRQGVYVIATSGSTGSPKPVLVTHEALANHMAWMAKTYPLGPQDRVLQRTATTFDASVWEFWAPLLEGVPLVMAEAGLHADPRHLVELMAQHQVTVAQFVPTVLGLVAAEPGAETLEHLRRVFAGGEALTWPLVDRVRSVWRAELVNLYGPTEATIDALHTPWPHDRGLGESIGVPIAGLQAAVVDEDLQPLPPGVPGELVLGGVGLARGYLGAPGTTAERFVPDPWSITPGQRIYRTGDRVRQRSDGAFQYLGRLDRQVKFRGQRLELGEVEVALRQLPGVAEAMARLSGSHELVAYVIPRADALQEPGAGGDSPEGAAASTGHAATALAQEGVQAWRSLYAQIYGPQSDAQDASFDITGWTSSETGAPLPPSHMQAWRDATVQRIRQLQPRRLFEIGCGTGLLLFPLAPSLERYSGVDFSAEVIERTAGGVRQRGWSNVQLQTLAAHEAALQIPLETDTVVLNSVIQYFPSLDYLTDVLCECAHRLAIGGRLFIGDIRHAGLLWAHHARVQLHRARPDDTLAAWATRVRQAVHDEEELLLDPGYFEHLGALMPRLAQVQVLVKPLREDNELARHRYDVVLHLDTPRHTELPPASSRRPPQRPADLAAWLQGEPDEGRWRIEPLANGRLQAEPLLQAALRQADDGRTVSDLRRQVQQLTPEADPQDWLEAALQCSGAQAEIGWSSLGGTGQIRLLIWKATPVPAAQASAPVGRPPRAITANASAGQREPSEHRRRLAAAAHDPLAARWARALVPAWRTSLAERLPAGFLPSHILCLQAWPLLPSGKLDLRALPSPVRSRSEHLGVQEAPQGEREQALARVWMQVLGLQRIGRRDNFFDLGGHSLLAVMLSSAVGRQLGLRLSVADVFQHPTLADQSALLAHAIEAASSPALTDDRPVFASSGPAVFAFPPLLGWGVAFLELARELPDWQVWALDFHEDDPDPVGRCVQTIERIQPTGVLRLLGYSAGARLAADCTERLVRMGREVQILVTLDGEVRPPASFDAQAREAILLDNVHHFESVIAHREDVRRPYEALGLREGLMRRMRGYLTYLDQPISTYRLQMPVVHIRSGPADASSAGQAPEPTPPSELSGTSWHRHTRGPVQIVQGFGDHASMTVPPHAAGNAALVDRALRGELTKKADGQVTRTEIPSADGP